MGLLKGISPLISPDLLHVLASMGHGDKIVLADANFPAHSICTGPQNSSSRYVDASGINITDLLPAILQLLPIEGNAIVMNTSDMDMDNIDSDFVPAIRETYKNILEKFGASVELKRKSRFNFYDEAKSSYAVVLTGERALYANIILTKGVLLPSPEN